MLQAKRKKIIVTMEQKLDAIKRIDGGEPLKQIALEFGVGSSTVSDWKRNRKGIENFCAKMESMDALADRSTSKQARDKNLDDALFVWFMNERDGGMPMTGTLLKEKARSLNRLINGEGSFAASEGWLQRWKNRHGIWQLPFTGEKISGDVNASELFKTEINKIVLNLKLVPEQVYNADETGLYYKLLPKKVVTSKTEKEALGFKISKVTLMACSNATGSHKLPLVVIGKSQKHKVLKNTDENCVPAIYYYQKSAWMTSAIFKDWFFSHFVPSVTRYLDERKLPRRAVLFLDNAPSHPNIEELISGNIAAHFFPLNVSALIQPMEQGVLQSLKMHYRQKLLSLLLEKQSNDDNISIVDDNIPIVDDNIPIVDDNIPIVDDNISIVASLKLVNTHSVLLMTSSSWECIGKNQIKNSWKKAWPSLYEGTESEEQVEVRTSIFIDAFKSLGCDVQEDDIVEWLKSDSTPVLTDEDIVTLVINDLGDSSDGEETEKSKGDHPTSHAQASTMYEKLMEYQESQSDTSLIDLAHLKRLRDRAVKKQLSVTAKQQKLTDSLT